MRDTAAVSELHGFLCVDCRHSVEVWTSARNREVGVTCCGKPMRRQWTEYPKEILAANLDRLLAGEPPLMSRGDAMDLLDPRNGDDD